MKTVRLSETDLSRRAVERGGWLSALPRDPGEDPPTFPRRATRERTRLPARRSDFNPTRGHR